jgi:hypothetical protein
MEQRHRVFLGLTGPDFAVLAGYIAVLCVAIPHYLPWEDEGRAWTAVRYFGLFDLIFHFLRYEGHPAIWYVILWPLANLHLPYAYINWLSAACGVGGIYFLLRYSPFPLYVRAVLPFGFALAYEYAVVARSYCLFPLFGLMIAQEYRQPARRPVRMAIFLALLANLSVHGTIVAVAFGVSYAWDLYRERRAAAEPTWSLQQARLAGGIFAASLAFVLIVIWPSRDLQPPVSPGVARMLHKAAPAAYQPTVHPVRLLQTSADRAPEPSTTPTQLALNLGMGSMKIAGRLRTTFVYPIATFAPLAILFQVLVFALVWRRGKPLLIAAPLLLGAFIVQIYLRLWHTSLIWVALIMLLWAVWDEQESLTRATLQNAVAAVFALICLLQVPWTVAALRFERGHATYPAKAAADYLKSLPQSARIDGFDHAFTVLPYFTIYPFHLQKDILDVPAVLADRPDAILMRDSTATADQLAQLAQAGYQREHKFCGTPFFPNQPLATLCLVVLEKP